MTFEKDHISSSKSGKLSDRFDNHVFNCTENRDMEPFFDIYVFLELSEARLLLSYESMLQDKSYDTINRK